MLKSQKGCCASLKAYLTQVNRRDFCVAPRGYYSIFTWRYVCASARILVGVSFVCLHSAVSFQVSNITCTDAVVYVLRQITQETVKCWVDLTSNATLKCVALFQCQPFSSPVYTLAQLGAVGAVLPGKYFSISSRLPPVISYFISHYMFFFVRFEGGKRKSCSGCHRFQLHQCVYQMQYTRHIS